MDETLDLLQKKAIAKVLEVINYADENNLINSQEFIYFLDDLNELSIRY